MLNGRVKTESIAAQVYSILKDQITEGEYLPGEKISEQTVADRLEISRSPVREAIRRLANEGLIDYYPNRGAFVKNYSSKNVSDSFEVRLLLEKYAIAHIDPVLREKNAGEMRAMQQKLKTAARTDYMQLDAELHEGIVKLCGNDALLSIYRLLYSQILTFREISLVDEAMFRLATRSHLAILDAILDGNDERALRIITKHLTESEEQVQRYYLRKRGE